ncbi:MAG TPA: HEAT repeat domain-containing protein [Gammaproteobacteria bacterium]|nr:HEAT repeat domain-containing protein [Gammaproteobacteria bacterium]
MNLFNSFQADRLISQIREEADPTSPNAKKAFQKLGKLGNAAVPKIFEALASADKRQTVEYVELLSSLIDDKTLPLIVRGLADSDPRTVSGTAWALSTNKRYNINRLVDFLGEDDYSKAAIVEVLTAHKDRLNVRQLLGQIYNLQPSEKAAVFKLVDDVATEELVPDLLTRMDGKDPVVKMHLINVVARFDMPAVSKALLESLKDPNKLVRQAALAGIARSKGTIDVALIANLLLDPDLEVMNKAVEVICRANHPETAKYLLPALKAENEFSRRAAVEILNEIGTTHSIKYLLEAVGDDDWWVRSRASDALARIGGPRVIDAVLELIKDKDENIRRSAIEILCTCRDKRALDRLIEATKDQDWWVSERAADALAEIGDAKALPALLEMMARNNRSLPVALRAIGKVGSVKILDKVLPYLQRTEKDVRVAAIEAVAQLAGEQQADAVRPYIQQAAAGAEETVVRAVNKAMQRLEGKTSPSGRFTATATITPTSVTPTPAPGPMSAGTRGAARNATVVITQPPAQSTSATSTARTLLVEGPDDRVETPPPEAPSFDLNALNPGDMIEGRYKFIQKIGKGAFGTVVLVEDTVVEERLILKFLNANVASDEEMLKRFVHELRYSRRITHKNVIRIYDFLYVGGSYAISMEYFPSHTLGAEIANEKPMKPKKVVAYACDICVGMSVAHQQGIIHRDLKPANILIDDTGLLKIVDFGVAAAAKSGDTQLTKTGYVIGSPKYMAPEQILGKKVDERADIYSLGVIMYEMLAGSPPYSRGDHMSVMYQHVQGKAQPLNEVNTSISRELSDIVGKTMQVDKAKRHNSMEELRAALAHCAPSLG